MSRSDPVTRYLRLICNYLSFLYKKLLWISSSSLGTMGFVLKHGMKASLKERG